MAGMFARACVVKVLLLLLAATLASGSHVHHGRDCNSLTRGRVKFVCPAFCRAFTHLPRYPVTGRVPNRSQEARNLPTRCFQYRSTAGCWRLGVACRLSGGGERVMERNRRTGRRPCTRPTLAVPAMAESFEPVAMCLGVTTSLGVGYSDCLNQ